MTFQIAWKKAVQGITLFAAMFFIAISTEAINQPLESGQLANPDEPNVPQDKTGGMWLNEKNVESSPGG